jgi:hypothetical protein
MPLSDLLILVRNGFRMETVPGPIPQTTIVRLYRPNGELNQELVYPDGCIDSRCRSREHRRDRAVAIP